MKKSALLVVALVSAFLWGAGAKSWAAPPVKDIVERAHRAAYYAGRDGRARVVMTIEDESGRKSMRQFTMLRKNAESGDAQKYLVVFERPSELRKSVFLVHKRPSADDDRWLFLPALDLVKRISAGDERTSFVGSHFLYEDVSGRAPNLDHHSLLRISKDSYVIKGVPKVPASVEFAYYEAHIDQTTFLPRKIEYFDERGKSRRSMEAREMRVVDGHPTVTKIEVVDRHRGGRTMIAFQSVKYDLSLPEAIFTERSLRSPPRAYLRTE